MTRSLTIDYGDEVLLALGMTPDEFSKEARTLIAVKLCEMGRLSTGAAAELANLPKPLFLTKLAAYGVDTFDMSEDELQGDVASARRHLVPVSVSGGLASSAANPVRIGADTAGCGGGIGRRQKT